MKYTSINPIYESPRAEQGKFDNPFVQTSELKKEMDLNNEVSIQFSLSLKYLKNGQEVMIEKGKPEAFKEYQPALILNENDEEEDLWDFVDRGGTYNKERVLQWGRFSASILENRILDATTIWSSDIQFNQSEPEKSIGKDWFDENIPIQGLPIGDNFLYDEQS